LADLFQSLPLRSWGERLTAWRQSGWARPVLAVGGGTLALGVLVAIGLAFLRSSTPPPTLTLPRAQPGAAPTDTQAAGPGPAPASPSPLPSSPPVTVTVHVAGQVTGPGVYAVPAGARVADAIVAAGGMSAEADVEQLNLAAHVSDGERIYVPKKGETPPVAPAGSPVPATGSAGGGKTAVPGAPLDLNTATADQLDALPGVGPATSTAILAYRSSHGRFRSVTELLEVPGIGPTKLETLRPLVRI